MQTDIPVVAFLLALSLSSTASAATEAPEHAERESFKCFISTNVGDGVYDFSWYAADTARNMAELVGQRLANSAMRAKGIRVYAGEVHECVPQDRDFAAQKARTLDEAMAR
ncbi:MULTISPECIES: TapY2 family type IVa secretion system protein [Shewanella]|uniref:TapY2 family type IVa secretion system protein n=1 Tax=Shewanella TaxID=22 RepID=UPI001C661FC8|nr:MULTISPECIES: TapY2 family type IVa secretion system protein [Shewanella]QYJ76363.1 TapY2 family type IVa secretion system protein [Shewanella sp. FJAT-52076]QYK06279.1 TapY2 family type IVa secretion system protein [Shewanella zhangzhouensis]